MLGVFAVVRPQPTVEKSMAVILIALPSFCTLLLPTHLLERKPFGDPGSDLCKVGSADTPRPMPLSQSSIDDRIAPFEYAKLIRDLVFSSRFCPEANRVCKILFLASASFEVCTCFSTSCLQRRSLMPPAALRQPPSGQNLPRQSHLAAASTFEMASLSVEPAGKTKALSHSIFLV